MTDFAEIGQAREKMLSIKLEQMTDSVSGSSTIDPKGYLTGLNSQILKTDAEIGCVTALSGLGSTDSAAATSSAPERSSSP